MRRNYFKHPIRKRFIDAFPKFKDTNGVETYFWETWQASPFYDSTLTETDLQDVYNHLLAHFYNWHYVYPDDLGIALNTMHIIHDYYPNVKQRLALVKDLRDMTVDEFAKSGIQIDSQGSNPKTATDMDDLIDLVDSQNASFQLRSQEGAIRAKFASLVDGIFDEFTDRFKPLFVKLYSGVNNYIYTNKFDEEEEEDDGNE